MDFGWLCLEGSKYLMYVLAFSVAATLTLTFNFVNTQNISVRMRVRFPSANVIAHRALVLVLMNYPSRLLLKTNLGAFNSK